MKTNNLVLISVGIIMIAAVVVGFLVAKPVSMVRTKAPVFVGQELLVNKAAKVMVAEKTIVKPLQIESVSALPIIPPSIAYRVLPQYPMSALQKGLEGAVLLSVYVGLSGQPEQVQVKSSSGLAEFDQSAISAVSQWKFNPASQAGAALASWFEIPVSFKLLED